MRMTGKRLTRFLLAGTLVAIGAPLTLAAANAPAAACPGGPVAAGTPCSITGTLNVTSGALTIAPPPSLNWGATVSGLDQSLVDPTLADQTYQINDATGVASGWHVTTTATQFTRTDPTTAVLDNTGTFSTNGSLTAATDTTAPTVACVTTSTCTLPTNLTTYPIAFTTGPAVTPVNIYDAAAATGVGGMNVSSVGWWLNVPANTAAGAYTSTVTLELVSGP